MPTPDATQALVEAALEAQGVLTALHTDLVHGRPVLRVAGPALWDRLARQAQSAKEGLERALAAYREAR